MKKPFKVLNVVDYILAICCFILCTLEWTGVQHTLPLGVGFLWLAVAFAAMDRISQRK